MVEDMQLITEVLDNAEYGVLALQGDKPYAIPVNFVYYKNAIYFHGSYKGKKMDLIRSNPHASFNVVTNHSVIPSYIMSKDELACPATAFFKSVTIDGKIELIDTNEEKRKIFDALMKKLQPEGKYISFDSEKYNGVLERVAVLKINIESISAKFKFGQNYTKSKKEFILNNLKNRNTPNDNEIVKLMSVFDKS